MASVTRIARIAWKRNVIKYAINQAHRNNNLNLHRKNIGPLSLIRFQHTEVDHKDDDYHSIVKNTEKSVGDSTKHEFQAETRMLLDIVARSLYSEKEVFIRELISNASDALEKFRYLSVSEVESGRIKDGDRSLEIHISTDKNARTFTIQDTGIGMTKDELIQNLGIIAKSGSKAFLEEIKQKQAAGDNNIIGQFGVGFYSAFMVADKVEVFTRSSEDDQSWKWSSDGTGNYEIQPADGVQLGTKITLHLKGDCREFSDEDTIKNIITKYSNFVGSPIYLNGKKANIVQPLWLKEPKSVTPQEHMEFYKFISGSYDVPRYTLHYKTDAPLSIAALLYFPEGKPGLFEMSRETESGIALYTKKVLIKSRTDNILPKWLRFVKGVVDSEDIPLNLSRELLQNSNLIRKLRDVLTARVSKFLLDHLKKDQAEYEKFYQDYGLFIKEGIITNHNQMEKEDAAKLLLFESSHLEPGKKITLPDYISRAKEDRTIFYLAAPSRTLAESSPYYESLKKKQQEVLFCYEPYDELVLMQLQQFQGYRLVSVEKDMRDDKAASDLTNLGDDSLKRSEINDLSSWIKDKLVGKVTSVNATTRLENHPCVVTVEEMAAARHFIRTQSHGLPEDRRYAILQPTFEINPRHPIIKKLYKLKGSDPELAELLARQSNHSDIKMPKQLNSRCKELVASLIHYFELECDNDEPLLPVTAIRELFANSMVGAGLVEDPRVLLTSMNDLLVKALEKH